MDEINTDEYLPNEWGWVKNLVPKFIKNIDSGEYQKRDVEDVASMDRANIITSKDKDGFNYLMLDIDDSNIYLNPSSTRGHYHLIFPNPIADDDYKKLINLLVACGIIKDGNFKQYKDYGYFALRTPWVPKGKTDEMYQKGLIGSDKGFDSDQDALESLQKACNYLGVEFPNEIYQQLNAKLATSQVDVPDTIPVDFN